MNQEEALALYHLGRTSWNKWADNLMSAKKELIREDKWAADYQSMRGMPDYLFEGLIGLNDETSCWLASARVDFDGCKFDEKVSFSGFHFPDTCSFAEAGFQQAADFRNAMFHGDAIFKRAEFFDDVTFNDSRFFGSARFDSVKIRGDGSFHSVKFDDDVTFDFSEFLARGWFDVTGGNYRETKFSGAASFYKARFVVGAGFSGAIFDGPSTFTEADFGGFSYFKGAIFKSDVRFKSCLFAGWINFSNAQFQSNAIFDYATAAERSEFDLRASSFARPPSFFGCKINPAPRVGDMTIKVSRFGLVRDATVSSRYRILKSFAVNDGDYANQLEFFAQEIRTSRLHGDGFFTQRFWFGIFYELSSNFGRSFLRPFFLLTLSTLLFGLLYFTEAEHANHNRTSLIAGSTAVLEKPRPWHVVNALVNGLPCIDTVGTLASSKYDVLSYAMAISLKNALVLPGVGRAIDETTAYRCMYGAALSSDVNGRVGEVLIPFSFSLWSSVQSLLSGILIFLCGIALRNMLRFQ